MNHTLSVPRADSCSVAVLGGGSAGVFAAIAAARCGADTVLIEKNSRPGGTITSAEVNFPGLFFAWGKPIIAGPCWEAILRTVELGGAVLPEISYKPKRHWHEQIRVNPLIFTHVLMEMLAETGVTVLCDTMLTCAEQSPESVRLLLTDRAGIRSLTADVAVDCTGDAALVRQLGYPVEKSDPQQPATLQNHLSGYRMEDVDPAVLREKLALSPLAGQISADALLHYLRIAKIDNHIPSRDADCAEGHYALERAALSEMVRLISFLRTVPGLTKLTADRIAAETGVRETFRTAGEHVITAEEYLRGEIYPDSVCYSFYPIDLHVQGGIDQTYLSDGVVPKIPYRALIPRGAKRILTAGRCVSSDTYANSALRVQASCMAMGQAAGCAAAMAVRNGCGVGNIPYGALCDALRGIGAIVPETITK